MSKVHLCDKCTRIPSHIKHKLNIFRTDCRRAIKGKEEARKEIGLIGMAHRTTYVLQSTLAHPSHMIEGFVQGLMARRPALFNMYTSCQPEHGIGDDMGQFQAKLA